MQILKKIFERQFARFLIVGGLNTIFGYGVFALSIYMGFHYSLASLFSTILGILFNFQTIGRLVFVDYRHSLFLKFFAVYGLTFLLNIIGLFLLNSIGVSDYLGGAIMILPSAVISFSLNKIFVFNAIKISKIESVKTE